MKFGSLATAWPMSWHEIWAPLEESDDCPPDLFMLLYRDLVDAFATRPEGTLLAAITNNPDRSRLVFQGARPKDFSGDAQLAHFFEEAYEAIADADDALGERYFSLVEEFLVRHNLRFRLSRPFHFTPYMPGVIASIIEDAVDSHAADEHLAALADDVAHALDALSRSGSPTDMKTLIAKSSMYVEGVAGVAVGAKGGTLSDHCKAFQHWPHQAFKASVQNLYGFCSDFPGLRHAGNPSAQLREVDLRDSLVVSAIFLALASYFSDNVDFHTVVALRSGTRGA